MEYKAMRKIAIDEINFLNLCLKKYADNDDWDMFSFTLSKRRNYLDITYKLGLLDYAEYEKQSFDDKFEMLDVEKEVKLYEERC